MNMQCLIKQIIKSYQNLLIEENGQAKQIFSESSSQSIGRRYSQVRNVVTSRSMMDALAQMSAWSVERWIRHDEPAFIDPKAVVDLASVRRSAFLCENL